MLKMTIDNEEVISKNDFTIKEEMLSASSTILNNCYPKTWEQDHDYTTRFYYPKDYSKMTLNKETHILPEPGSYATINGSGQIQNVDSTKESELVSLKGDTYQYTTTGANLFNYEDTENVSSATVDENGWITMTIDNTSGTSTKYANYFTNNLNLNVSTNYRIVVEVKNVSYTGNVRMYFVSTYQTQSQFTLEYNPLLSTLSNNTTYAETRQTISDFTNSYRGLRTTCSFPAGTKGSITFRLSVLADTSITPSTFVYQPYTGGLPSPSPTYPQSIDIVSGLQEVEIVGKNLWNKGNSYEWNWTSATWYFINGVVGAYGSNIGTKTTYKYYLEQGNIYYFKFTIDDDSKIYGSRLTWSDETSSGVQRISSSASTGEVVYKITATRNDYIIPSFSTYNQEQSTIKIYNVQLEKDNDTTYEPYKGKTYDVNLGKQLFNYDDTHYFRFPSASTLTKTDNIITFANSLDNNHGYVWWNIPVQIGKQISISYSNMVEETTQSASGVYYVFSDTPITAYGNDISTNATQINKTNKYTTTTATKQYMTIILRVRMVGSISVSGLIVNYGTPETYAEYFTPIELCKIGTYQDKIFKGKGINLLDIQGIVKGRLDNGVLGYESGTTSLTLNDNSFSFTTNANWRGATSDYIRVSPNTDYIVSANDISGITTLCACYDINKTFISNTTTINIDSKSRKYTTPNNTAYIRLNYQLASSGTIIVNNPMIQEGSVATDYEPYNAKDKWLLHKEIRHLSLPIANMNNGEDYPGWSNVEQIKIDYPNKNASFRTAGASYITNVIQQPSSGSDYVFMNTNNTNKTLFLSKAMFGLTQTQWKTNYPNLVFDIYYTLKAPETIEIDNSELVSELNNIELIGGINNITISSFNLPAIMDLHYNFVTERTDVDLIFSGIVKNTSDISLNPREPKYCSLEILDYKTLLSEGDTLDYVISNKTILEAIDMVVDSISSYGFELGNVNILNGNDIIGTYSTYNKTAYDVLQYLADISGAKWTCRQKDNNSMYIDFYDPTLMPQGKQIEYTNEWACENNLVDLTFNYGTRDYRNKQVILSDTVIGDIDYNENFLANSVNTDFVLQNNISSISKILVNGEEKNVGTKTDKELGIYLDFYYTPGNNIVSSNEILESGNLIQVSYKPIIKGREVITNDDEIERLNTQLEVNGTIARYDTRNDETDSNKLLAIGETYLKYKGEAEITLTLKTFNKDLYNVGQSVYFNAPIQELAKNYMVKSKEINVIASGDDMFNIFYTYTLSSSFNAERQVNWFDNQRNKTTGNINEGEYISRNIDISSTATIIWDNVTATEITGIVGDNVLDSVLDSPYNE